MELSSSDITRLALSEYYMSRIDGSHSRREIPDEDVWSSQRHSRYNWEIATEFMSGCIVGPDSPLDRELCLIVRKNIRKNLLPSNVSLTYVQCPCVLPVLGHPPSTLPVHQRTRTQILVDEDVMRYDKQNLQRSSEFQPFSVFFEVNEVGIHLLFSCYLRLRVSPL